MLDSFEQAAADCTFAVAILGNVHSQDFELVPLGEVISADMDRRFRARGLCFLGVLGLPDRFALAEPMPPVQMRLAIAREFDRVYGQAVKPVGDSVTWLENLHSLPDTRDEA
jgi:hypothetical protein